MLTFLFRNAVVTVLLPGCHAVKTPREVSTDDPLDVSSLSCALAVATLILFDNVVARATQEFVGFPAAAG